MFASGCSGGPEPTSPATVDEIKAAFEHQGIELTEIVVPATENALVTVLAPRDSDQISVSVLRTTGQARHLFQAATGEEPQFELAVDSDVAFTTRNVYVLMSTASSDYSIDAVRDALRELS